MVCCLPKEYTRPAAFLKRLILQKECYTNGPELELYGETFDPRDPAAGFEVYIPVFKP